MRILSIETSCDDTGIAIIETERNESADDITERASEPLQLVRAPRAVTVLSNQLASQPMHASYGGVFPTVAKREHARALAPLIRNALGESGMLTAVHTPLSQEQRTHLETMLTREPELLSDLLPFFESVATPDIDAIAVTHGPGLEPCLWVGINCARALAYVWNKPLLGINHMEGHIYAALAAETMKDTGNTTQDPNTRAQQSYTVHLKSSVFPCISLLISGGHTEFVLSEHAGSYQVIGQTRDDAVGECFDKTARMLGFPYPGGPKISSHAARAREEQLRSDTRLPRPMIDSGTLDFSFSGLKTAVLMLLKKIDDTHGAEHTVRNNPQLTDALAREIEDAIVDVLVSKTRLALTTTRAATCIVSGGVSANTRIREALAALVEREFPDTTLLISPRNLSTDNALMIALASIEKVERGLFSNADVLTASGNLRLS